MGGVLGILASLAGAASFGSGDFAGGLASRRAGGLAVAAAAQVVGLSALVVGLVALRPPLPGTDGLLIGLAAGVAGGVGLAALYVGLAIGAMGLVAALSGLGSVTVPVVVGAVAGVVLSPLQLLGVGMAGMAAIAAGGASREGVSGRALVLAGIAALAFGSWYVLLDLAAKAADPLWGLVISRATSAVLIGAIALVGGRATGLRPVGALVLPRRPARRRRQRPLRRRALADPGRPRRRAHRALPARHDAARAIRAEGGIAAARARRRRARHRRRRAHLARVSLT